MVPSPSGGVRPGGNSELKSKSVSIWKSEWRQAPLPAQQDPLLVLTCLPKAAALLPRSVCAHLGTSGVCCRGSCAGGVGPQVGACRALVLVLETGAHPQQQWVCWPSSRLQEREGSQVPAALNHWVSKQCTGSHGLEAGRLSCIENLASPEWSSAKGCLRACASCPTD